MTIVPSKAIWVGAIVAVAAAAFVALVPESRGPNPAAAAQEEPASATARLMAAAARIQAQSQDAHPAPTVVSAPRPLTTSRMAESSDPPPSPPDGYAFATHHGEMAKAPLDERHRDRPDDNESMPHWINSSSALETLADQAARAGRDWSFGWIWLASGWEAEGLRRDLRRLGGEILGSAGRLARARLPGDIDRLKSLLALDGVGGLGAVPGRLKLPSALESDAAQEQLPVFITLMADDPDGRWRRVLEGMGAVVGWFDADTRAYAANVSHGALDALARADFVLAVEPVRLVEAAHDTAVPALGADALRTFRSPGMFLGGGASVPIGVMDTGLNVNHLDISSNRRSICGANFVSASGRLEDLDLWVDEAGHGTHVTGTIVGNGFIDARLAGVAPSVGHIRLAKALDRTGGGDSASVVRAMDFLSRPAGCEAEGQTGVRVRPLIVNASLATGGRAFTGREVDQRKLDAMVWRHRQLYVVVQGNEGQLGSSNTSAAKNSLAVGAVRDGGALAFFSSHGPTADGRLAPQIVAPGVSIRSPAGGGSRGEYQTASGTSSAAPAAAGVAALLMDAVPAYRRQPALTRARLMASAVKPDPWFEAARRFPANNTAGPGDLQAQYGLGKVSARTSVLNRARPEGWTNGSATSELKGGEYAFQDIVVPEGASRLDLVLTWDEPPADTISATVLNDLDLWLDQDGDCESAACGEHSSLSRKDNVEWIVVRDPAAGVHRAKVLPKRVYAAAPRAALAWTVIRGASTPTLQMRANRDRVPAGRSRLRLALTSDAYVAAGTRLRVDCRPADGSSCRDVRLHGVRASREDRAPGRGVEWAMGTHLTLGELGAGENQAIELFVDYEGKGSGAVRLYFTATSWNASGTVLTVKAGAVGTQVPVAPTPGNDDFSRALAIDGAKGSVDLDLASATAEAGEQPVAPSPAGGTAFGSGHPPGAGRGRREPPRGRPAASVWYDWTAPATGYFQFSLSHRPSDAEPIYIEVHTGDDLMGLDRVASNVAENGDFLAQQGVTYRVRVSNGTHRTEDFGRSTPVTLGWSAVEAPANDDFGFGALIEGTEGQFAGSNRGATLQSGEWFGGLASTVWHHWTAPLTGAVRFDASSGLVMAFTGEGVAELRLVSQRPDDKAVFPVRSGAQYRIAVAAHSAVAAGAPYELAWKYVDRRAGNDDFSGAEPIGSEASSSRNVDVDGDSTVQPGEPPETGVRSKWWAWTAPESGTYTWRLDDATLAPMRISAFSGESLGSLRLEGVPGLAVASHEFTLAAVKDRRYWISTGLPKDDFSAFAEDDLSAPLAWGPTPANDQPAKAAPLSGAAGSTAGSSAFATVDSGERTRGLGHSSLWWTYEPQADGWYRFHLEGASQPHALAVYEIAEDGSLSLLEVSQRPGARTVGGAPSSNTPGQGPPVPSVAAELIYRADAGRRYLIRLGALSDGLGGEFTLRWAETVAPVRFRFLGYLEGGDADPAGAYVDPDHLAGLSGLAIDQGGMLYAASSSGLVVFERDSASGLLFLSQAKPKDWSGTPRSLLYDPRRRLLHAHGCGAWDVFSTAAARLVDQGRDEVGEGLCADGRAFMDSEESSVYVVRPSEGVTVLGFDGVGRLRREQAIEIPDVTDAVMANGDSYVYAVTSSALMAFERNGATGTLAQSGFQPLPQGFADAFRSGLAISGDGGHLFAFTDSPWDNEAAVFDLRADPSKPAALHALPLDEHLDLPPGAASGCRFAGSRTGTPGIGLFCDGSILGLQWNAQSGQLKLTDSVKRVDRFNNALPHFGAPRSLALSPDGRHAYLATESSGILFFERVGNFD